MLRPYDRRPSTFYLLPSNFSLPMTDQHLPRPRIAVVHGPNLNLLGVREPRLYGHSTLDDIHAALRHEADSLGVDIVSTFQSNHEGVLIDHLHALRGQVHGILLNGGALTHTSIALRDAIAAIEVPTVEVHLSNVYAREEFRQVSVTASVCVGGVFGLGVGSYRAALVGLTEYLRRV